MSYFKVLNYLILHSNTSTNVFCVFGFGQDVISNNVEHPETGGTSASPGHNSLHKTRQLTMIFFVVHFCVARPLPEICDPNPVVSHKYL